MNSKLIEVQDLTEEEIAGGSKAAEKVFTKSDDFPGGR